MWTTMGTEASIESSFIKHWLKLQQFVLFM